MPTRMLHDALHLLPQIGDSLAAAALLEIVVVQARPPLRAPLRASDGSATVWSAA